MNCAPFVFVRIRDITQVQIVEGLGLACKTSTACVTRSAVGVLMPGLCWMPDLCCTESARSHGMAASPSRLPQPPKRMCLPPTVMKEWPDLASGSAPATAAGPQ